MTILFHRLCTDLLPYTLYLLGSVFFVAGTVIVIKRAVCG